MVYIIFLRGINVGGKAKVSMSVLKKALLNANFSSVSTLLNSGNVIVKCDFKVSEIESKLSKIIKETFDLDTHLMVYTLDDLKYLIDCDPFDDKYDDFSKKCIGFTGSITKDKSSENIPRGDNSWFDGFDEIIYFISNQLYLYYVNGQGRSKLTSLALEKKIGQPVTVRNWNTVQKAYNLALEVSNET